MKIRALILALCLVSLTAVDAEARCGRLFGGKLRKAFAKVVHPRGNCSTLSNSSACEGAACADGACRAK